jgi:hypothetical protein
LNRASVRAGRRCDLPASAGPPEEQHHSATYMRARPFTDQSDLSRVSAPSGAASLLAPLATPKQPFTLQAGTPEGRHSSRGQLSCCQGAAVWDVLSSRLVSVSHARRRSFRLRRTPAPTSTPSTCAKARSELHGTSESRLKRALHVTRMVAWEYDPTTREI